MNERESKASQGLAPGQLLSKGLASARIKTNLHEGMYAFEMTLYMLPLITLLGISNAFFLPKCSTINYVQKFLPSLNWF